MERHMTTEARKSMIRLQREYVSMSLSYLEEIIRIATELDKTSDPAMIEEYNQRLSELEKLVDENYDIARKIEESIK